MHFVPCFSVLHVQHLICHASDFHWNMHASVMCVVYVVPLHMCWNCIVLMCSWWTLLTVLLCCLCGKCYASNLKPVKDLNQSLDSAPRIRVIRTWPIRASPSRIRAIFWPTRWSGHLVHQNITSDSIQDLPPHQISEPSRFFPCVNHVLDLPFSMLWSTFCLLLPVLFLMFWMSWLILCLWKWSWHD